MPRHASHGPQGLPRHRPAGWIGRSAKSVVEDSTTDTADFLSDWFKKGITKNVEGIAKQRVLRSLVRWKPRTYFAVNYVQATT